MNEFKGKCSKRIEQTKESIIYEAMSIFQEGSSSSLPPFNLAQGMVYWGPCKSFGELNEEVQKQNQLQWIDRYGAIEGIEVLRNEIKKKLREENKYSYDREVYVTPGSNAAFQSVLLTLCDPGDEVVLFAPYFFNHHMSITLSGAIPKVVPFDPKDFLPSIGDFEAAVGEKTRVVVICNPSNPSGVIYSPSLIQHVQKYCQERGIWIISDEAYEDFVYDGQDHVSTDGPNVINLFTFSKGASLAGWRIGYMAFPPSLTPQFAKIQDSIFIHASHIGQFFAAQHCQEGRIRTKQFVKSLEVHRDLFWNAIKHIPGTVKTNGAFYYLIPVPKGMKESEALRFIFEKYNIKLLSAKGCGAPGYLRIAFAVIPPELVESCSTRLEKALKDLYK
eukprot:TRINITY_DN4808_c0_g1_i2.p1 TRINITY_DN4808_c0_g1~~TRINITY_DN4808_c0_g1_i2.p1  ORF type:complete len:389 (+),score=93.72 TRINITY_DN4808_c0_g1_i2:59-1225(+)